MWTCVGHPRVDHMVFSANRAFLGTPVHSNDLHCYFGMLRTMRKGKSWQGDSKNGACENGYLIAAAQHERSTSQKVSSRPCSKCCSIWSSSSWLNEQGGIVDLLPEVLSFSVARVAGKERILSDMHEGQHMLQSMSCRVPFFTILTRDSSPSDETTSP